MCPWSGPAPTSLQRWTSSGQSASPGKGRSAGVVSSDLIYGLVRMFELSVKGMKDLEVRVFRETEPVFDWLREDF